MISHSLRISFSCILQFPRGFIITGFEVEEEEEEEVGGGKILEVVLGGGGGSRDANQFCFLCAENPSFDEISINNNKSISLFHFPCCCCFLSASSSMSSSSSSSLLISPQLLLLLTTNLRLEFD